MSLHCVELDVKPYSVQFPADPLPPVFLLHLLQNKIFRGSSSKTFTGRYPSVQPARPTVTHTHPFNGPLSRTTQVSWYQKGKTNLDFTGARDSERQWYHLGHMQVCISLQTDNHARTSLLKFFTGQMPFLPANQQCQNTEGYRPTVTITVKAFSIMLRNVESSGHFIFR